MRRGGGPEIVRSVERPFRTASVSERQAAGGGSASGRRASRPPGKPAASSMSAPPSPSGAACAAFVAVQRSLALAVRLPACSGKAPPGPKRTGWKPVRRGSWDGLK